MSLTFENETNLETPPTSNDSNSAITLNAEGEAGSQQVAEETAQPKPLPSLKDLPSLGSNAGLVNTKINWGPNVKPAAAPSISSSPSPSPSSLTSGSRPMRSKTIQEAFSLDLQSQLSIGKPEFSRIVQSVKQNHNVSVESTLSKSSRTFLISGVPQNVYAARRELVRKLTKPITDVIQVPSNCKAAIIGSGGKNIREIQDSCDVRINVAKENNPDSYDEDLDDYTADVSIHGDIDSVKLAKSKIMKIVKEEDKHATIQFTVDDEKLLPFVDLSAVGFKDDVKVQFLKNSATVVIQGPREDAKEAKQNIKNYLLSLSNDVVSEQVTIPTKFQFLIDDKEIKEKFNVIVQYPTQADDEKVSFVGPRSRVREAIEFARTSSKAYAVDTLDISKSHGKNLAHAKNLALFFKKYDYLKNLQEAHPTIKIVLPSPEVLAVSDCVNIHISGKAEEKEEIKATRKELISLVNQISPLDTTVIDDVDYELFHKEIKHTLVGQEELAAFVQFGDFYPGNDAILLIALSSNEDFKPSAEEIAETLKKVSAALNDIRKKQDALETRTFELAADTQDLLLNENSATLKLILEDISQEEGHLQIKLHTPTENELTLKGNERAVNIANKAIESVVKAPSQKFKDVIEIPANAVSRLIGTKGANTQQLRQKYDIQIDVPSESESGKPVSVTLTGLQYNVEHAKVFIAAEAKKWADIITKELIAAPKYHRNLLGPQGAYRNRLQDKYNVRILFPRNEDIITIRGPSRGVAKAYQELEALLDFEMENGHKSIIKVPAEHVPRIIGKNGDMINDIRAEFAVEMDFLQKTTDSQVQESGEVELEITGSRQAIQDATKKVKDIVAEASDFVKETLDIDRKYHKTIVGAGGRTLREIISKAGGDEYRNKTVDVPNANSDSQLIKVEGPKKFVDIVVKEIKKLVEEGENSIKAELDIPAERQGALIGPGGVVRRQLESEFNVILNVPNKGESGKVTLQGLPDNVEKAKSKILSEIIRDNFDHELSVPANLHEFVSERGAFIQNLRTELSINVRHGNGAKKANKISRKALNIPTERVRGSDEEKIKFTIEDVTLDDSNEVGEISWRLSYEPVDLTAILGEGEEQKEDGKDEANKKQSAINKAVQLIEERIALAPQATSAGYIWSSDTKKFNKIVGPGGSNIKKIREASGTIINVPKRSDKVNDVVYIRGTSEGVKKAGELILKALKN
ncbi:hypothetical protein HG536_0F01720 [Torulaspora globosa]|uniref:K Homology domain-containing protein n=1 Tax=Torulaspora globosa TaxID=48254 RepID=A0A7G3ZK11_9SACH|nr:uncharacterized protein HG536_0F01720 [Torulaspora globosa]QLL33847.1 hypothetical protein HG536_0F01720 [Torulaspora globosa]